MGLLIGVMLISLATFAWAGVPDMVKSSASMAGGVQVSVYNLPNGGGDPLTAARLFGGGTINATITLTLLDVNSTPIFEYPFSDMWLETADGGLKFCPGGTTADADTDLLGQTEWTNALFAGCSGIGTVVVVSGNVVTGLSGNVLPMDHNSPDINCSLNVNLTDLVLYAQDVGIGYAYRSDFYWSGALNLSDLILFAQGSASACP
jgi:hypothetical protein